MRLSDVETHLPVHWSPMDIYEQKMTIVPVIQGSQEYIEVMGYMQGNYYKSIKGIYRIQNPFTFMKFKMKHAEYKAKGGVAVKPLYHDTSYENTESICLYNLDWRYGRRYKYGPGVYFSVSPTLANRHSAKKGEPHRCMFLVDVLMSNVQLVHDGIDIFLPDLYYDTVLCHGGQTYVKYFDCEYYPHYFVEYISKHFF